VARPLGFYSNTTSLFLKEETQGEKKMQGKREESEGEEQGTWKEEEGGQGWREEEGRGKRRPTASTELNNLNEM